MPRGYVGVAVAAFTPGEVAAALALALALQIVFFSVLISVSNATVIKEEKENAKKPIPISVKPVLDDLPLLKLGGKRVKTRLPDMWKKQAPIKRFKAKSAPSPDAKDQVDAIPTSELAKGDAEAPPPDADLAKELDEAMQPEAGADAEATAEGEGAPDGVKEGTETDPLKARAVSQYQIKILNWFNSRFVPPTTGAPCDQLKQLTAAVAANVGGDRSVASYALTRPSGNATFDAKVRATMDGIIGQQLPPPPPLYPDILGTTVQPVFSGRKAKCQQPASAPSASSQP